MNWKICRLDTVRRRNCRFCSEKVENKRKKGRKTGKIVTEMQKNVSLRAKNVITGR